jgi:hypothetical protein
MKHLKQLSASILILSALLLNGVNNGSAQVSPTPRPTIPKSEQSNFHAKESAKNNNQANQNQNPVGEQRHSRPKTSSDNSADKQSDPDKLTLFTGALVVVGVVQAIILWFTVVVSRASTRAYILARCENAAGISVNEKPRVVIVLKNFGHSPAYHLRFCAQIAFDEYPMKRDPGLKYDKPYSTEMTISPGVEYGNPVVASTPLTETHILEIAAHKGQMFIYGKILYRTLWMRRYTKFAFFILQGTLPMLSPFGNDAN